MPPLTMTGLRRRRKPPIMQPGDKVRVTSSVVVFHHPQNRGQAFDLKGQEGEVVSVLENWKGRPISPTLPVVVAFGKFRAHLRADELTGLN